MLIDLQNEKKPTIVKEHWLDKTMFAQILDIQLRSIEIEPESLTQISTNLSSLSQLEYRLEVAA